jgi:hypothetical protein
MNSATQRQQSRDYIKDNLLSGTWAKSGKTYSRSTGETITKSNQGWIVDFKEIYTTLNAAMWNVNQKYERETR